MADRGRMSETIDQNKQNIIQNNGVIARHVPALRRGNGAHQRWPRPSAEHRPVADHPELAVALMDLVRDAPDAGLRTRPTGPRTAPFDDGMGMSGRNLSRQTQIATPPQKASEDPNAANVGRALQCANGWRFCAGSDVGSCGGGPVAPMSGRQRQH